jgi:hypothetical protein
MNKSFFIVCLIFFLSSCDIKKRVITDFSIPPKNSNELINRVHSKNYYPQWLSLKGRVSIIKQNDEINVGLSIKNRKDSVIWISARGPFGIEIARAQLTPDSIYFIDRINKSYFVRPINRLSDFIKLDLSFYDIQDIITANSRIHKNNYKMQAKKFGFYLVAEKYSYFISSNYSVQNTKIIDNNNNFEFIQDDYHEADNFPRKTTLKIESDEIIMATVNYSNVEFNKPQKILFKIPKSYDEIY